MKLLAILGSVALACTGLLSKPAIAADCTLKLVNTVSIKMAYEGRRAIVPVIINGTEKPFLLNTGGYATQISAAAAQELKLPPTESGGKLLDLYGKASERAVVAETFVLGRLGDKRTRLPIMTFDDNKLYSGILAADYMGKYDIEMDFAGGKMNYFSQDHCPGKVVYWPAPAAPVVPMRFVDHHLILDVSLDGHSFKAILDTGSPVTTLTMGEARRVFGLTPTDGEKSFQHVFQKLAFEGLEVGNPHVVVIPEKVGSKDANNHFVTGSRVHRVDDSDSSDPTMLIGMNILSKLRFTIAFQEQKIYLTPASSPTAQPQ